MEAEVRKSGNGIITIDLKGRLVAGTGAEQLKAIFNELLAADWRRIILNLSEISRIDSAGIGELVAGIRLAKRFDSQVKLLHVRGQVRDILALSQLLPLLDIYYSEEEAIEAFDNVLPESTQDGGEE